VISALLVLHLGALAVATVPSADELRLASGKREQEANGGSVDDEDAISVRVRPVMETSGGLVSGFAGGAWALTMPMRSVAKRYVNTLGLVQNWQMFANPPRGSEYLRLRYYSAPGAARIAGRQDRAWTVTTELVFPVAPDDQSHTMAAFWQAHRDKAISNAFGAYFRARISRIDAGLPPPVAHDLDGALARTLVPVTRYFAARYVQTALPRDERLVRTEVWYGWGRSRARGELSVAPESRAGALARYYAGRSQQQVSRPPFQPLDTLEREADLVWMLIHVDER